MASQINYAEEYAQEKNERKTGETYRELLMYSTWSRKNTRERERAL